MRHVVAGLTLLCASVTGWAAPAPVSGFVSHAQLAGLLMSPANTHAALLRQAPPLQWVAELKTPVMIVQGRLDRRVERVDAYRFVSAAQSAGVTVERHDYQDSHGFFVPEHHADFLGKLEAFLARHLVTRPN